MTRRSAPAAPRRQRGITVLLMVLLIGLAAAITVLAALHALRGGQQRQLTTHAATAAQAAAWRGVETLRRVLADAGAERMQEWGGPPDGTWTGTCAAGGEALDLDLDGSAAIGVPRARLTHICRTDTQDRYRITAQVTGQAGDGSARTTATVEVVYEVGADIGGAPGETGGGGSTSPLVSVITFNNDLNLSGSINVQSDADTRTQINVQGDLTTGGNTISGVDTIWGTGSIRISSGSSFGTLRANGDIRFDGSVTATQLVEARGDICVEGGANAAQATIRANGSVTGNGGVTLGDVSAIGRSDRGDQSGFCDAIALDADGAPYAVDLQGNAGANSVTADGSVRIASGSIARQPDGLRATGHLVDTNWGGTEYGQVGGTVTGANPETSTWVRSVPGLTVAIAPVSPVVLGTMNFNAYDLESQAHYAFKIDANGYKVVRVRDIAHIANGTYFIGDYDNTAETGWSRGYRDFLCTELAAGSTPQAPRCRPPVADPPGTICQGQSSYNGCLSYDANTRTWTVSAIGIAQGIAWFEGDLDLALGTYYNSFVATGNVSTGGQLDVYALRYAGFDGTRSVDGSTVRYAPTGICANSRFPLLYPLDYCDMDTRTFSAPSGTSIGNYALLAGSYGEDGRYQGGDIRLGASNRIFGSVLSGNLYASGGSTTIHGTITALSQGEATHAAGGSTTINLIDLPDTFVPAPPACALTGTCVEETPTGSGAVDARVMWTRYL
ncbi:FapA family protein [Luteimonas sp. XNQY3]|nr:FapA family protein [Luteimonas sp. XNQY3]MCD9004675.1 FapA family protein [Luteimonas sp. XNQY3]